jgi:hypothetical protein
MAYGPFSPFQRLTAIHFPGTGPTGPFPSGFLYYDITYTLTVIGGNPPLESAIGQISPLSDPGNADVGSFGYGLGTVSVSFSLRQVKGGACILDLFDTSDNFAGLIDVANVGLGRQAGFVGMWGSIVATGHFTNGLVTVKSPVSPTVGQSGVNATASDGIGGELYHAYRGAGLPQNQLHFDFPGDTIFGVQILVSPDFNRTKPSGSTSVLSFFSTDLAPPVSNALITHRVA